MPAKITVRVVQTPNELARVYQFRYKIYVEEMSRYQSHADHKRRQIEDPLDVGAVNLVAFRSGDVVGVCRINFARDCDKGFYERFYDMTLVGGDHPAHTSISTHLMIRSGVFLGCFDRRCQALNGGKRGTIGERGKNLWTLAETACHGCTNHCPYYGRSVGGISDTSVH